MFEASYDDIILESSDTLSRIEKSKTYKKDLEEVIKESKDRFDIGRHYFEEYDERSFKTKLHIDLLFMEQLLEKLTPEQNVQVEELITSMYSDVKAIYEFTNIEPEVYGKFDETLLNENEQTIKNKLSKKIYTFLENRFYKLPPSRRYEKYSERITPRSKELLAEGVTAEEAVAYSTKQCLMEDFITDLSFPFAIKSRLQYLLENEAYGEIFDQVRLNELYDNFKTKVKAISKITAVCV
jgi:hypothetical protein